MYEEVLIAKHQHIVLPVRIQSAHNQGPPKGKLATNKTHRLGVMAGLPFRFMSALDP